MILVTQGLMTRAIRRGEIAVRRMGLKRVSGADRFLDWLYYTTGLNAFDAQRLLSVKERNALVTQWLHSGCPYPVGV